MVTNENKPCFVFFRDIPLLNERISDFSNILRTLKNIDIHLFYESSKFPVSEHIKLVSENLNKVHYFNLPRVIAVNSKISLLLIGILSIWHLVRFIIFLLSTKNLNKFQLVYKKIALTDLIYDQYIRSNNNYEYPLLNLLLLAKIIFTSLLKTNYLLDKTIKYNAVLYVISTRSYTELGSIAFRIALQNNVKVYEISSKPKYYSKKEEFTQPESFIDSNLINSYKKRSTWSTEIKEYISFLSAAKINDQKHTFINEDLLNAYSRKKNLAKPEIVRYIFDNPSKNNFNVLIATHAFSDANHVAGDLIYRDYFSWYINTLKIVKSIKNVNWIFKFHPSRSYYGEDNIAEKYFYKYKEDHMYLFPDFISTAGVFQIADVVVTARGTIGLEASCMGIPTILCGESPWSHLGFSNNAKTPHEYRKFLENIKEFDRLDRNSVDLARCAAHSYFFSGYIDDFANSQRKEFNATEEQRVYPAHKEYIFFQKQVLASYERFIKSGNFNFNE